MVEFPQSFVRSLSDEVDQLNAAIQRVRAIHEPSDWDVKWRDWPPGPECVECECHYPCPTIEAIEGEE